MTTRRELLESLKERLRQDEAIKMNTYHERVVMFRSSDDPIRAAYCAVIVSQRAGLSEERTARRFTDASSMFDWIEAELDSLHGTESK